MSVRDKNKHPTAFSVLIRFWGTDQNTNKRPAGNALEGADGVCICGAKEKYLVGRKKVAYYIRGVYTVQEH